jgi:GR25 family glycosyltransferase involved in LPS biosynthesis
MKVFVISLKRAKERRDRIIKHLAKKNIEFELFDAVDGQLLSDKEIESLCDMDVLKKNAAWLTKGMVGACLSHYNVYKKIIELKLPYACIVEDDVEINDDFNAILKDLENKIEARKFIMLHYTSWQHMELKKEEPIAPAYTLCEMKVLEGVNSAACYIISQELCHKFIDKILPIRRGPDSWTEFAQMGVLEHIFAIYPKPAKIVYAKSTIDYIQKGSIKYYISNLINDYKLFPLYQLLKYRRRKMYEKMNRMKIVD